MNAFKSKFFKVIYRHSLNVNRLADLITKINAKSKIS